MQTLHCCKVSIRGANPPFAAKTSMQVTLANTGILTPAWPLKCVCLHPGGLQAYRLLAEEMYAKGWDYPLHLGVTEVGSQWPCEATSKLRLKATAAPLSADAYGPPALGGMCVQLLWVLQPLLKPLHDGGDPRQNHVWRQTHHSFSLTRGP